MRIFAATALIAIVITLASTIIGSALNLHIWTARV